MIVKSGEAADSVSVDASVDRVRHAAEAYLQLITARRGGIRPTTGEGLALKAAFCAGAAFQREQAQTCSN